MQGSLVLDPWAWCSIWSRIWDSDAKISKCTYQVRNCNWPCNSRTRRSWTVVGAPTEASRPRRGRASEIQPPRDRGRPRAKPGGGGCDGQSSVSVAPSLWRVRPQVGVRGILVLRLRGPCRIHLHSESHTAVELESNCGTALFGESRSLGLALEQKLRDYDYIEGNTNDERQQTRLRGQETDKT